MAHATDVVVAAATEEISPFAAKALHTQTILDALCSCGISKDLALMIVGYYDWWSSAVFQTGVFRQYSDQFKVLFAELTTTHYVQMSTVRFYDLDQKQRKLDEDDDEDDGVAQSVAPPQVACIREADICHVHYLETIHSSIVYRYYPLRCLVVFSVADYFVFMHAVVETRTTGGVTIDASLVDLHYSHSLAACIVQLHHHVSNTSAWRHAKNERERVQLPMFSSDYMIDIVNARCVQAIE